MRCEVQHVYRSSTRLLGSFAILHDLGCSLAVVRIRIVEQLNQCQYPRGSFFAPPWYVLLVQQTWGCLRYPRSKADSQAAMSGLADEPDGGRDAHTKDDSNFLESRQIRPDEKNANQLVENGGQSPNQGIRTSLSKTSSPASLNQQNDHDEEKGLPLAEQSPKDTTEVINAEHDPNIVYWEDDEPGNPYN